MDKVYKSSVPARERPLARRGPARLCLFGVRRCLTGRHRPV